MSNVSVPPTGRLLRGLASSIYRKPAVIIVASLCLTTHGTFCRAQAESKSFGKFVSGTDTLTLKAVRATQLSHGAKTWKRQLEIIINRPYSAQDFWSDEHYTEKDIAGLRKALAELTLRYQQWKGKHLGTQSDEQEVRRLTDPPVAAAITIALQMDEMGHIAVLLQQGSVGFETDGSQLAKFRAAINSAAAWVAAAHATGAAATKPAK